MARPLAKDHDEKRGAILKTAARFFSETGFDRASMNQLAVECGISKALIYHYYQNKESLLFDILKRHLSKLRDAVRAAENDALPPEENFRNLVHAILENYRGADSEHRLQLEAMRLLQGSQQRELAAIQRDVVACMEQAIGRIDEPAFSANERLKRPTTMALFGMLNWFYLWHRPGKGISRKEFAELAAQLLVGGVRSL